MARPRNQEARRAQLGEAVQRAVLERGVDGVRLKDVADQAGVTSAAVLYYYEAVEDLVAETYQRSVDRFCLEREEAARRHDDARDQLRACIDVGVATGPDDDVARLLVELIPRSLRDPAVGVLDNALYDRQEAVYQSVLARGREQGHFTFVDAPKDLAASFVALEDGYQLEVLAGRRSRAYVLARLFTFAKAATGCDLQGAK